MGKVAGWSLLAGTWLVLCSWRWSGAEITCRACRSPVQPHGPRQGSAVPVWPGRGRQERGFPAEAAGKAAAAPTTRQPGPRASPARPGAPLQGAAPWLPAQLGEEGSPAGRAPRSRRRRSQVEGKRAQGVPAEREAAAASPEQPAGKATRFRLEELRLSSSTFALTGDSAHNQAMVHWSGHNSSEQSGGCLACLGDCSPSALAQISAVGTATTQSGRLRFQDRRRIHGSGRGSFLKFTCALPWRSVPLAVGTRRLAACALKLVLERQKLGKRADYIFKAGRLGACKEQREYREEIRRDAGLAGTCFRPL